MEEARNNAEERLLFPTSVLVVVAIGLILRGVDAARKSLWIEELNSLQIAGAENVAGVIERLTPDFHQPGHVLGLHLLDGIPGEWLRWTSIVAGLLTLVPLLALCRAGGLSPRARLAVAAVYSFAPYQIQYGTELQAYPFLELVSVTLAWAAFTSERSSRFRFGTFALAAALGLYLHHFTGIAVLAVGVARVLVKRPEWLRWRTVFTAGLLGVLAFLPWILVERGATPYPELRDAASAVAEGRGWTPRASDLIKALVLIPRTFVPMLGSLGSPGALIAKTGAGAFFLALLFTILRALRPTGGARPAVGDTLRGVLLTCVVTYALVLGVSLYLWQRTPEQYFVTCAWLWPIAVGLLLDRASLAVQPRLLWLLSATALLTGVGHVVGDAREDFRGGVEAARRMAGDRDALFTGVLSQPPWFSDLVPYEEYAPNLRRAEPLDISPEEEVVIVLLRESSLTLQPRKWEPILMGREFEESFNVDGSVWVHVYVRRSR